MNFRHILKDTIKNMQRFFPNANYNNSVSQWFARNQYAEKILLNYGLSGNFFDIYEILNARDPHGRLLKGSTIRRLGKAALKQGKVASLTKMREFFITGMGVHHMPFDIHPSVPYYNVNKAIKFNTLNK